MAGKQFKLDILISATDKLTAPLARINNRIKQLTAPGRQLANAVAAIGQESGLTLVLDRAKRVVSALGDVGAAAMTVGRRIAGIGAAGIGLAYLFKREFIDTASTFENLRVSLEGIEGSAEKAATSMAFIKKLTVETPMQLADITRAFRLMRGQGMDPMNGSLVNLTNYVSKLGGSGDMLMSISTQLSQAWSKQKLQQQDIRVMAEEGVGVWGLLSRAIERTSKGAIKASDKTLIPRLMKASEQGLLGPKYISLLMEQMGLESQGANTRMMSTWTGIISNIADQWSFFKLRVMEAGPFERIKRIVQGILERVTAMAANGELQRWADRIAAKFEQIFLWVERNGPRILGQIASNLATIFSAANRIAEAVGGWGNLLAFGGAAYVFGPLAVSIWGVVAAVAALNGGLLGTPAGWLLLAGGAGLAIALKSLKWPSAAPAAAGAPTFQRAPLMEGLAYLNPFKRLPTDETAAAMSTAPPVTVAPPSRATLTLSPEDQAAIAAAFNANGGAAAGRLKIDIQHSNVPPGTKLRVDKSGNLPIDLSRGVSMAHAF